MLFVSNKIWFSQQEDIFLPLVHQNALRELASLTLIEPNAFQVNLVVWKKLLNQQARHDAKTFCDNHKINLIDLDDIVALITTSSVSTELKDKQLKLVSVAKLELREWVLGNGGNPAVASDIIRFLPILLASTPQEQRYYTDCKIALELEKNIIRVIHSQKHNSMLNISSVSVNNDMLYFSSHATPMIIDAINFMLKQVCEFNDKFKNGFEKSLTKKLNEYPDEHHYIDKKTTIFFSDKMLENSALETIRTRKQLLDHITPKDIDNCLMNRDYPVIFKYTIRSVLEYCGPIVVKHLINLDNVKCTNSDAGDRLHDSILKQAQFSWHPIEHWRWKDNFLLTRAYRASKKQQNFMLNVNFIFIMIGEKFFKKNKLQKTAAENSQLPFNSGDILYQFKSRLTSSAVKYLYDLNKNGTFTVCLDDFIDALLNGKPTASHSNATYRELFGMVKIVDKYNEKNITALDWLKNIRTIAYFSHEELNKDDIAIPALEDYTVSYGLF